MSSTCTTYRIIRTAVHHPLLPIELNVCIISLTASSGQTERNPTTTTKRHISIQTLCFLLLFFFLAPHRSRNIYSSRYAQKHTRKNLHKTISRCPVTDAQQRRIALFLRLPFHCRSQYYPPMCCVCFNELHFLHVDRLAFLRIVRCLGHLEMHTAYACSICTSINHRLAVGFQLIAYYSISSFAIRRLSFHTSSIEQWAKEQWTDQWICPYSMQNRLIKLKLVDSF